ncbi:hypothetical protein JCM8547_007609 [Rhodosporidiobolus lusitaniae]
MAFSAMLTNRRAQDKEVVEKVQVALARGEEPEEPVVNDVFGGQGSQGEINYRSVGFFSTTVILCKASIGLGVLTIPSSFNTLGLIPGLIVLLVSAVFTTWSALETGYFKQRHPEVYTLQDAGRLIFGRPGSIIFGAAIWLYMVFVAGSAIIGISTALNALSLHGACTAAFVAVATVITLLFALLPKISNIKLLGWLALVCIIVAVMIIVVGTPAGGRPNLAPQEGPWDKGFQLFGSPTFSDAMNAVSNLYFAYSGVAVFMPIASEMRDVRQFGAAAISCQVIMTVFYVVVGTVVYYYAGTYVASPALGTAGTLLKRIAYGISLPGLIFSAVLFSHLAGKMLFVRLLRGSYHLNHPTSKHWLVWVSCILGCVLFSYVIAEAIPVFDGLVGLVGALFGTFMGLHAQALMYLFDIRGFFKLKDERTPRRCIGVVLNVGLLVLASFLLVAGTYGSAVYIKNDYEKNGGTPWSCADNSNSS